MGDTIYEKTFGNFKPPRCVVTAVPPDVRQSVTARCDGSERTRSIARRDLFYAFEPATVSNVAPGQFLYFENMRWAMVVGKSEGTIAIRGAGFAAKDKLVVVSKVQRVR